jgi:pSer/pThr/pTyr-binding forkhead associated (FHA) protein
MSHMRASPLEPYRSTPEELRERLGAERRGRPFLVLRDAVDHQQIVDLGLAAERITLGRSAQCDVPLEWDPKISRLHAELERIDEVWVVVDDGLSSNGTHVGGERVVGRRRLRHGDVIRLGDTMVAFCAPGDASPGTTLADDIRVAAATVTEAQRKVLVALCRPFKNQVTDAVPATNPQIAEELVLTVAAVKTHLRALFRAFGLEDLPQSEKRRKLVAAALASGLVQDRDL